MSQSTAKMGHIPGISPYGLGGMAHGRWVIRKQGNCLALVLRSEGLMALPLITTSVTRNVKEDFHAEERRSMISAKYNGFFILLYGIERCGSL